MREILGQAQSNPNLEPVEQVPLAFPPSQGRVEWGPGRSLGRSAGAAGVAADGTAVIQEVSNGSKTADLR